MSSNTRYSRDMYDDSIVHDSSYNQAISDVLQALAEKGVDGVTPNGLSFYYKETTLNIIKQLRKK
jgi:hypothetical protein